MLQIGYVYEQLYSIRDEKTGAAKSGVTTYALVHRLNDGGNIVHTDTYKVARCYNAVAGTIYDTEPFFDKYGKLAGFFEGANK